MYLGQLHKKAVRDRLRNVSCSMKSCRKFVALLALQDAINAETMWTPLCLVNTCYPIVLRVSPFPATHKVERMKIVPWWTLQVETERPAYQIQRQTFLNHLDKLGGLIEGPKQKLTDFRFVLPSPSMYALLTGVSAPL